MFCIVCKVTFSILNDISKCVVINRRLDKSISTQIVIKHVSDDRRPKRTAAARATVPGPVPGALGARDSARVHRYAYVRSFGRPVMFRSCYGQAPGPRLPSFNLILEALLVPPTPLYLLYHSKSGKRGGFSFLPLYELISRYKPNLLRLLKIKVNPCENYRAT